MYHQYGTNLTISHVYGCMKTFTLIEGEDLEPEYSGYGHMEFTQKVLRRCKDKNKHGLTGTIKIDDIEPSKRITLFNASGEEFLIRYHIMWANPVKWKAAYTLYKYADVPTGVVVISEGTALAKYCWEEL
jgi:hypothetical protein